MAEARSKHRTKTAVARTPSIDSSSKNRFRSITAALAIVFACGFAYSNSFAGAFVFDDEPAIAHNASLSSMPPLAAAFAAPRDTTLAGRPLTTLTFALDHARSGGTLAGYHATNLLIHLLASLLVFGVVRRTLQAHESRVSPSPRDTSVAFGVAILFAVHPLQTGSVTYIVQRVESLMGLLYLATLYASIRAFDERVWPRRFWTLACLVACALGMGAKEVMVTAPLMVMLWDRQFGPEGRRSRPGLYVGLAATWAILGALVAGGHRSSSAGLGFEAWPWWRYLLTQAEVIPHYIRLSVYPSPLVLDYDWRPVLSVSDVALPGLLVVTLLGLTIWGVVRRQPLSFAGVWFFLILAPTSSVLPIVTEVAAEHRMYLPLAAVLALVVLGLASMEGRVNASLRLPLRVVGALCLLVVTVVFANRTRARNLDYQDFDRIWSDTIAKRPLNARARNNYASSLLTRGRFAEAETHLRVAVEQDSGNVEAQANLGVALSAQNKLDEGAAHLEQAVLLKPGFTEAYRNLGENYAMRHRLGDAAKAYLRALEALPSDLALLNRAAWILATCPDDKVRNGGLARVLAERAVELTAARDPSSLDTLAAATAELGDFEGAKSAVQRAIEIARPGGDPAFIRDLESRAALYARGQKVRTP